MGFNKDQKIKNKDQAIVEYLATQKDEFFYWVLFYIF